MRRQQVGIDAGFVVKALQVRRRHQLNEVAIAFLVLAQQDQMVVAVRIVLERLPLLRDIHLAADHGVDALLLGRVVELDRAEQVAVVGHGDGGHFLLGDGVHELGDLACAVEQRVIGVAVQMYEGRIGHSPCSAR